jgi:DNA polymerase III epsilon subunit-like protein
VFVIDFETMGRSQRVEVTEVSCFDVFGRGAVRSYCNPLRNEWECGAVELHGILAQFLDLLPTKTTFQQV